MKRVASLVVGVLALLCFAPRPALGGTTCSCSQSRDGLWVQIPSTRRLWNLFHLQCFDDDTNALTWQTTLALYPNLPACQFDADRYSGRPRSIPAHDASVGSCVCHAQQYSARFSTFYSRVDGFRLLCASASGAVAYDSMSDGRFYPSVRSCQWDGTRTRFQ